MPTARDDHDLVVEREALNVHQRVGAIRPHDRKLPDTKIVDDVVSAKAGKRRAVISHAAIKNVVPRASKQDVRSPTAEHHIGNLRTEYPIRALGPTLGERQCRGIEPIVSVCGAVIVLSRFDIDWTERGGGTRPIVRHHRISRVVVLRIDRRGALKRMFEAERMPDFVQYDRISARTWRQLGVITRVEIRIQKNVATDTRQKRHGRLHAVIESVPYRGYEACPAIC